MNNPHGNAIISAEELIGFLNEGGAQFVVKTNQLMVDEFHKAFDLPVREEAEVPTSVPERALRRRLIEEETKEFFEAYDANDLVGMAKEAADVLYVLYGWAAEAGVDLDAVFLAVHDSNMSKLGPDGKPVKRADGKVLKGPGYYEPPIAVVLGLED